MRKLFLFAITAILIAPNAHAEVGVTGGNGLTYSCMLYSIADSPLSSFIEDTSLGTDTTGCTSTKFLHWTRRNLQNASQVSKLYKEYCTACSSKYRLVETTGTSAGCKVTWTYCQPICAGKPCEGKTSWSAHPNASTNHNQTTCVRGSTPSADKCSFRCTSGYYGTSTLLPGGNVEKTEITCTRCPSYQRYINSTTGYATTAYGTSIAGSNALITSCYIPSGIYSGDETGRFLVTGGNCSYKQSIIVNPPVVGN